MSLREQIVDHCTRLHLTIAGVALVALTSSASAALTFLPTTITPIGQIQPGWTVAAQHGPFNGGLASFGGPFASAYYWGSESGLPLIANNATGSNGGIGSYEYFIFRQSFDLTGFNPATATLSFQWGCDDVPSTNAVGWTPAFSLNSAALAGTGTCGAYSAGNLVTISSGFVSGLNTIDFYVEGNGQTDGLGVTNVSLTAATIGNRVPEPWPLALLMIGATGMVVTSRRYRRAVPHASA